MVYQIGRRVQFLYFGSIDNQYAADGWMHFPIEHGNQIRLNLKKKNQSIFPSISANKTH